MIVAQPAEHRNRPVTCNLQSTGSLTIGISRSSRSSLQRCFGWRSPIEASSEIGLEVPLEYRNIPPQLEITGDMTNTVQVRLRGSSNVIKDITAKDVSTTIDLEQNDDAARRSCRCRLRTFRRRLERK